MKDYVRLKESGATEVPQFWLVTCKQRSIISIPI
jgi:hypothetical protein